MLCRLAFATCLLSVLLCGSAQAQPASPPPDLDRATYIQNTDADFQQMDADKNGELTRVEIERSQRAALVAAAQAKNRATFAELDADKNGQLSPIEFAKVIPQFNPNAQPIIVQLDSNKNGQVSAVEYRAAKVAQYDKIDTDKNGILSAAELRAAGVIK